mgnify:CR=1
HKFRLLFVFFFFSKKTNEMLIRFLSDKLDFYRSCKSEKEIDPIFRFHDSHFETLKRFPHAWTDFKPNESNSI